MFFTDGRYTEQAKAEVAGARIVIAKGPLLEAAGKLVGELKSASIGFEGDHTSVVAAQGLRKVAHRKIAWKPTSGLIMRQRLVKDADELKLIREAIRLGADAYKKALRSMKAGVPEAEIAGRLEFAARQSGADGMSFDTIVAGGKARSAASWPSQRGAASAARICRRRLRGCVAGLLL